MKAIVTVLAKDTVGIIAYVSTLLAEKGVNILDISQTVMQEYFTMIMMVDISGSGMQFDELSRFLEKAGEERALSIRIQRQEVFEAMHRI